MDWLREIELDEYAGRLQGTGVSGPVMVSSHLPALLPGLLL